jgi:hypothetical protein
MLVDRQLPFETVKDESLVWSGIDSAEIKFAQECFQYLSLRIHRNAQ